MDVIYKITSPSGKVYIGRSKNYKKRWKEHRQLANSGKGYQLHEAIRKYGWDNMKKEILCEVSHKQAAIVEEQFIKAYDSYRNGYNAVESGAGGEFPYERRRDSDEFEEYRKKMSDATSGEKNGMYGKSHSEQTRNLQKQKAKGRFSLDWFIDRNGVGEGTRLYEERRMWLKNRNLKKDENGRFVKGG